MYQYSRMGRGGYWGGTGLNRMSLGGRENFLRMQEVGTPRFGKDIPVDVLYGMPQDIYMASENQYEQEAKHWQELYPERAKKVQKVVEEECDRLDYAGSFLYDEYPDRVTLKRMEDNIYQIILDKHLFDEELSAEAERAENEADEELEGTQMGYGPGPVRPPCRDGRCGQPPRPPHDGRRPCRKNDWLCEMIQVILYQEMTKRRCRGGWC